MAGLPIVRFDKGFQTTTRGTLHDCPAEFFSVGQLAFYSATKPGWSKCPMGYWTYAAYDAMGRKLVVPGIILTDEKNTTNKKFPNYSIRFSKLQIQNFLSSHLSSSETIRIERDNEFKNLTHDLRAIGAEIYNTALSARSAAEKHGEFIVKQLDNVMAAQQMLSLRLDIVDYESGHSAGRPKQSIPIFRKIDKVLRAFHNRFYQNGIRYRTEGLCFANVLGPPIFELIPFVLIENAIKYAPKGSELLIRFEQSSTQILVRFESFGPKINENERDRVFEQHFRGEHAQASERGGSGIGLYAARTLTKAQFGGNIYVNQEVERIWVNQKWLYRTTFTLALPILDDAKQRDNNRRARARRGRYRV